jgi:biopolymer transport protein TolQ
MFEVMPIYLAAIAQSSGAAETESLVKMVLEAELVIQLVLLILTVMSVACWAIIVNKSRVLKRATTESEEFLDLFWQAKRLDDVFDQIEHFPNAPVANLFKAGYVELARSGGGEAGGDQLDLGGTENLARAMRRAATVEQTFLERMIPFLATTGATAPFIGLFGTVWGILRAFQRIGATGQASIQTVGPDIANALIATAVGLLAAIPAVMAYNYFGNRVRVLASEMENFSNDFMNIVKRHLGRLKRAAHESAKG